MFTARSARPSAISRAAAQRAAADQRAGLVHPVEDRVVVGAEAVPGSSPASPAPRGPPSRYDGDVHPLQLGVRRGLRLEELDPLQHAELAGEPHGQVEPDRVERVVAAEVVGEELRCPHHRGSRAHGGT